MTSSILIVTIFTCKIFATFLSETGGPLWGLYLGTALPGPLFAVKPLKTTE